MVYYSCSRLNLWKRRPTISGHPAINDDIYSSGGDQWQIPIQLGSAFIDFTPSAPQRFWQCLSNKIAAWSQPISNTSYKLIHKSNHSKFKNIYEYQPNIFGLAIPIKYRSYPIWGPSKVIQIKDLAQIKAEKTDFGSGLLCTSDRCPYLHKSGEDQ